MSTVGERAGEAANVAVPPLLHRVLDAHHDETTLEEALHAAFAAGVSYGVAEALATLLEDGVIEEDD